MWRWLLIGMLAANTGLAIPTSVGPASAGEAEILWKEGREAYQAKRFSDAIYPLKRLVDRYPGYPGYLRAHLFLGRALLETGSPATAIAPLNYFIGAVSADPDSIHARLWLGDSYLKLHKFSEAYLESLEVEKLLGSKATGPLMTGALLLRAKALIGNGHDLRANQALDSARKALAKESSSDLRGETARVALILKTRACSALPAKGKLSEGQVRDQLDRRGSCLLEALLLFRSALEAGDERSAAGAKEQIQTAFHDYSKVCSNPNVPYGNRTAKQLSRYRRELRALLEQDCREKYANALELLKRWKPNIPRPTASYLEETQGALEKLASSSEQ